MSQEKSIDPQKQLIASVQQIAVINKFLPEGYRFVLWQNGEESDEDVIDQKVGPGRKKKKLTEGPLKKQMTDIHQEKKEDFYSINSSKQSYSGGQQMRKGMSITQSDFRTEKEYETTKKGKSDKDDQSSLRVSQRQKKPINFNDLGYEEKQGRPRGRPSNQVQALREAYQKCEKLISTLKKHPYSGFFSQIPEKNSKAYHLLIDDQYLDFGIIESNFKEGKYGYTDQLMTDILKVFIQAQKLQKDEPSYYQKSIDLKLFFEQQKQALGINSHPLKDVFNQKQINEVISQSQPTTQSNPIKEQQQKTKLAKQQKNIQEIQIKAMQEASEFSSQIKLAGQNQSSQYQANNQIQQQLPQFNNELSLKDLKQGQKVNNKNEDQVILDEVNDLDKPMSYTERQQLGHSIRLLNKDQLFGIVSIMQDLQSPNKQEVLEFDLKALSDRKCRELERFVNDCIRQQNLAKQQKYVNPSPDSPELVPNNLIPQQIITQLNVYQQNIPQQQVQFVQQMPLKQGGTDQKQPQDVPQTLQQYQMQQQLQQQQNIPQSLPNPAHMMNYQQMAPQQSQSFIYRGMPGYNMPNVPQDQFGMIYGNQQVQMIKDQQINQEGQDQYYIGQQQQPQQQYPQQNQYYMGLGQGYDQSLFQNQYQNPYGYGAPSQYAMSDDMGIAQPLFGSFYTGMMNANPGQNANNLQQFK